MGPAKRQGETVLITGASSGLGLALARELAGKAYRLILTARESSLPRFAAAGVIESQNLMLRPLEVTSAAQRRKVVEEVESRWGGVDILVNNAGISFRSVLEHVNEEERLVQMNVNFLSPMHLMRLVLPGMRRKRKGRIINISSVGGMMAMPTMAIYSASKFALEGATEALWYEVRPWGIHVTLVEPGFVRSTSFQNTHYTRDGERSAGDDHAGYHAHYENMEPFIGRVMGMAFATPDKVASRIARLICRKRPPLRYLPTVDAHLFALLRRILPRRIYHGLLYRCLPGVRSWGQPESTEDLG